MVDGTAPKRAEFQSEAQWLAAWIRRRLVDRPSVLVALPGVEDAAVHLHGSIGYDCAITSSGDVWVSEYELDGPDAFQGTWRPTGAQERLGYLVIAAGDHPELGALLPQRTALAQDCVPCKGTGERHFPTVDGDSVVVFPGMICEKCAGLGWLAG
jgi:hypothetical protein